MKGINTSVCLTAYNGEKYIYEQVQSILTQLGANDELIVCDDGSKDKTLSVLESFDDVRIKLFRNNKNLGHVRNFEKALSLARGKYIFLADQDDIWEPNKISKTIEVFKKNSDVSLVYHNLKLIDASGARVKHQAIPRAEKYKTPLLFLFRQLIKPQVFGCSCALNKAKIKTLLPFPKCVYAHDHWIAVWAALNGRVYFLQDALVNYRQHDNNLTPKKHLKLTIILKNRLLLCQQVLISLCRRFSHQSSSPVFQ